MVSVILMGMPVATTAVISDTEYNKKNLVKVSEASVFSTLTVPVITYAASIVV